MPKIMCDNFFIHINFHSETQAGYQLEQIEEVIDTVINKFSGKDYIVSGTSWLEGDDPVPEPSVETDADEFFDEYEGEDEPSPQSSEEYNDEKHKAFDMFIRFISTKKGLAQLEKMKEAFDAGLDKFEEKGLIASYSRGEGSEKDVTGEYSEEEIQEIQKEHNVKIHRYKGNIDS